MPGVKTLAAAGFIKLPRALLSEPWARRPASLALFVHLLAKANLEAKDWEGVRIERGQLVTSRSALVSATGISEKCVRNALQELEQAGRAKQRAYFGAKPFRASGAKQRAKSFTLITICNFDDYSGFGEMQGQAEGQAETEQRAKQRAKQRATTKEDIEKRLSIYLPEESGAFLSILADFFAYRIELQKPITAPSTIKAKAKQLKELSGGNLDTARGIVEQAITEGWQGLFPLKSTGPSSRGPSAKAAHDRLLIDKKDAFKTTI